MAENRQQERKKMLQDFWKGFVNASDGGVTVDVSTVSCTHVVLCEDRVDVSVENEERMMDLIEEVFTKNER